jgi:hypothetical protein
VDSALQVYYDRLSTANLILRALQTDPMLGSGTNIMVRMYRRSNIHLGAIAVHLSRWAA